MDKDTALHLALEVLEKINFDTGNPDAQDAIKPIKAALSGEAQTRSVVKDESVAWRDAAIRLGEELSSVGPDGYYDMDAKEWLDWAMEQNPRGEHSLPQRTWVGLTRMELIQCGVLPFGMSYKLCQTIEAKLKEKNT